MPRWEQRAVFTALGMVFATPGAWAQESVETDRAALVAFYHATDGANWTNDYKWLSDEPLGDWWGVATEGIHGTGRVIGLTFGFNNVTGPIPGGVLTQLTELRALHLSSNDLPGSIPAALGKMTTLRVLGLSHNHLTGSIPAELGQLVNLEHLDLRHNQLTGSIPAALGQTDRPWHGWVPASEPERQQPDRSDSCGTRAVDPSSLPYSTQ